ncbi:hypothetical protein [Paenibacillus eucommiae]|uniref:Uncharacterized protein n=1 Tax=Paenibacillus eucommiae TaxID=1355755 RepID=A0ABS4J8A0_9BACL|nr:hypothetical protein [Paenibacillus eucommiae]MBP1996065.1 hypothetical protein [Paenibacillus eucommiae]
MSVASHFQTTYNGKVVMLIKADIDCVSVENIAGSVPNSGKYGVNGTFFDPATGDLLGIAIKGGLAVKTGGLQSGQTCAVSTKRGTMYNYSPAYNFSFLETKVVKNHTDSGATASQMKWAIGGYSLHPNRTYTMCETLQTDNNCELDRLALALVLDRLLIWFLIWPHDLLIY